MYDRENRFCQEDFDELKAAGYLRLSTPTEFGGFGMSGVGSKAGGPDYLHQFLDPRVITENTLRQGFTPETA